MKAQKLECYIGALNLSPYVRFIEIQKNEKGLAMLKPSIVLFKKSSKGKIDVKAANLAARAGCSIFLRVGREIRTYKEADILFFSNGARLEIRMPSPWRISNNLVAPFGVVTEAMERFREAAREINLALAVPRNVWIPPQNPQFQLPEYLRGRYIAGIDMGAEDGEIYFTQQRYNAELEFRLIPPEEINQEGEDES